MKLKFLSHNERVAVKSEIRKAKQDTEGCSPLLRLVALEEARDTLKEDGIRLSIKQVERIAEAV